MTTLDGCVRPVAPPAAGRAPPWPWHRRTLPAVLALAAAYLGLSLLNDPRATLGTDTGIKVATLKVMQERGSWVPDIGYWAAPWDPEAVAHPFRDTRRMGDAYVDVTTLPMLYAAYPLWLAGGYRAALALPMAGGVAGALVARGLGRRLGGPEAGWRAFWLTGLASPVAVYALDLWEHTLGVALLGAAVLVLVDLVAGGPGPAPAPGDPAPAGEPSAGAARPAPAGGGAVTGPAPAGGAGAPGWPVALRRGLAAGVCCGLAFTMRTEALVYTATTFAVVLGVLVRRRSWWAALAAGGAGVAGLAAVAAANAVAEVAAVGATIRSARAAGTVPAAGAGPLDRLREGVVTLTSPFPSFEPADLALGVVLAAAMVGVAAWAGPGGDHRRALLAAAAVAAIAAARLGAGPGFWPGLVATTPLAAVGLARGWSVPGRRLLLVLALVPVPLVLTFQFTGGALPQWGGRYLLTSGLLLAVVGAAALGSLDRWARRAAVASAVTVTAAGVGWVAVRTHQVAGVLEPVRGRPEDVLVWTDGFVPRELAAVYGEGHWLAGAGPDRLGPALDVAGRVAPATLAVVGLGVDGEPPPAPPAVPGYRMTGRSEVPFLDPVHLAVTSYVRDDP